MILKKCFNDYLDNLNSTEKEAILIRHPDLAGKLADDGLLTLESRHEQKSAGLESMTKEEKQMLRTCNDLYKEKFKFPFVICARENKVQTILMAIQNRLQNTRETELLYGIQEVKKICNIRIDDLVWCDA
ncbi:hypothetical protein KM043_005338 [Ampulex compressa]|nr:hypothetical protein KM043_005338 [Ampulex compressa]